MNLCQAEWRYLLSGGMPAQELTNPAVSWLSERAWQDILSLSALASFSKLAESFPEHLEGFKRIFDSSNPHRQTFNNLFVHKNTLPRHLHCAEAATAHLTRCGYVCLQRGPPRGVGHGAGLFPEAADPALPEVGSPRSRPAGLCLSPVGTALHRTSGREAALLFSLFAFMLMLKTIFM